MLSAGLLGMVLLNYFVDFKEHASLRTDVNTLQYESNQHYKHRHYIDANGTTSGPPIHLRVRAPSGTNTNYLSGAWFS